MGADQRPRPLWRRMQPKYLAHSLLDVRRSLLFTVAIVYSKIHGMCACVVSVVGGGQGRGHDEPVEHEETRRARCALCFPPPSLLNTLLHLQLGCLYDMGNESQGTLESEQLQVDVT